MYSFYVELNKGLERLPLRLNKTFLHYRHAIIVREEGRRLLENLLIQPDMVLRQNELEKRRVQQVQVFAIEITGSQVVGRAVEIKIIEILTEDQGLQGKYRKHNGHKRSTYKDKRYIIRF